MRATLLISHGAAVIFASFALAASAALPVDRLATCAPPNSSIVIGGSDFPPLPPDFFFPGSLPFSGTIVLSGSALGSFSDADTLVRRSVDPFGTSDPPGGPVLVPIEIVALSLVSATPIIVNPGAELWDVRFALAFSPQPIGQMRATKTHANGGTFDATLPVVPMLTFTRLSDHTVAGPLASPVIVLEMSAVPWVHNPNPSLDLPVNPGTNFFPGILELIPGDPSSQARVPFTGVDPGFAQQTFCAATRVQGLPSLGPLGLAAAVLALLAAAMLAIHRGAPSRAGV